MLWYNMYCGLYSNTNPLILVQLNLEMRSDSRAVYQWVHMYVAIATHAARLVIQLTVNNACNKYKHIIATLK